MRTDGQTDMTKLTVAFPNFPKASEEKITKIEICFVSFGPVDYKSAAFHLIPPDTKARTQALKIPLRLLHSSLKRNSPHPNPTV